MKIKASDADRFVSKPDPAAILVLIYGPDEGLVRERSRVLASGVIGTPPDPMQITELTDADLKGDPARLADEAAALSLMPGARLVRIRTSGDGQARLIQSFLEDCAKGTLKAEALVIVEAGDLGPRSSLRKAAEDAANAAAVACYADDSRAIGTLIRTAVKERGLAIDPAAIDLLSQRLGEDRGVTRQEIDKLVLYKGADTSPITMDDVEACLPAETQGVGDMLADHVGCGEALALDRAYFRALQTGQPPASLLRGITMHFQNLHLWTGAVEEGRPPADVLRGARPPTAIYCPS